MFWKPLAKCVLSKPKQTPDVVLDAFGGSGTTAKVARDNGRFFISIDANKQAIDLTDKRLRDTAQLGHFGHQIEHAETPSLNDRFEFYYALYERGLCPLCAEVCEVEGDDDVIKLHTAGEGVYPCLASRKPYEWVVRAIENDPNA